MNYTSNSNVVYNGESKSSETESNSNQCSIRVNWQRTYNSRPRHGRLRIHHGARRQSKSSLRRSGLSLQLYALCLFGVLYRLTCVGMGGENISISIDHDHSRTFHSSGYADLITNDEYTGGVVRQHGNLSFTRVFEAEHEGKLPTS